MFNKIRLMCRYYSEILQWPLRRFWRWGMLLQSGEYRNAIDVNIETDSFEFSGELQFVRLNFTDHEALQIWKKAYVANMHQCDFIQVGKKGIWHNADGKVPMDDTVLRIGPDFMTVVGYANGQVLAKTVHGNYLNKVLDSFGLPNFEIA